MSFRKSFSLSTIIGFFLGAAFLGYVVFAYNPPTTVPPTQSVDVPVHTGSEPQIKEGNLWANSFGTTGGISVGGYLRIAQTTGAPPAGDCNCDGEVECGGDERGRIKYDPGADALFACNGASGWATINAGSAITCYRDADEDARTTSEFVAAIGSCPIGYAQTQTTDDCDDGNASIWRWNYADNDGDGFGGPTTGVCGNDSPGVGRVFDNTDCDDVDADRRPNQTGWFRGAPDSSMDYNCSGVIEKIGASYATSCSSTGNWGCSYGTSWVYGNCNTVVTSRGCVATGPDTCSYTYNNQDEYCH